MTRVPIFLFGFIAALGAFAAILGMNSSLGLANLKLMGSVIVSMRELLTLWVAMIFMFIAVIIEWNTIYNHIRVQSLPLSEIERIHPRLPGKFEVAVTTLLSIALTVLFFQSIATVYAMSFSLNSSSGEAYATTQVGFADIDGDGDLDYIAGSTSISTGDLDYYTNNGAGTFTRLGNSSLSAFKEFATGDLDGNGSTDIGIITGASVRKFINNGNGTFTETTVLMPISPPEHILLFDANNDGRLDIVTAGPGQSPLLLNDGHASFTQTSMSLPTNINKMAAADFNTDGYQDLAFVDSSSNLKIYVNSGTGSFTQLFSANSSAATSITAADLNGDGAIDVALVTNTIARPYFNNGAGTSFTSGLPIGSAASNQLVNHLAFGDVDNDGDLDAIVAMQDMFGVNGGNEIWLNDGLGVFTQTGTPTEATDCTYSVAIGDIDADGDLDYLAGNYSTAMGCGAGGVDRRYKSDQASTSANTAPSAPSDFTATTVATGTGQTRSGNTFVNGFGAGLGTSIDWTNVNNAGVSDNQYVSTTQTFLNPGETTHLLLATDFRFSVPDGATILGVKVAIERQDQDYQTEDYGTSLLKDGTNPVGSSNLSYFWDAVDTYQVHGNATYMWGTTLTPAEVNASTFGLAFAGINNSAGTTRPLVDYLNISVFYNTADVRLSWGSGSDTQTATRLLQYQLKVGTGSNSNNILSGKTSGPNYATRLMPNGQSRTMLLKNLVCGQTYYWNVATVDTGFKTTWGTEQSFTLAANCTVTAAAQSSSANVGGGLPFNVFHQTPEVIAPELATITVSAFHDLNADGKQNSGEQNGFGGLGVTASGRTLDGTEVHQSLSLSDAGKNTFQLLPSDERGYFITVDSGSLVLAGFEPTMFTMTGGFVLASSASKASVSFGFRKADLLAYKPCLSVGPEEKDERPGSDAFILLQRLTNIFGERVMDEKSLRDSLTTRKEFFRLIQRSHCIDTVTHAAASDALIDVPLLPFTASAQLVYSLLARDIDIARITTKGPAADFPSPVTRREAIRMIATLLRIPPEKQVRLSVSATPSLPGDSRSTGLSLDSMPSSLPLAPANSAPLSSGIPGLTPIPVLVLPGQISSSASSFSSSLSSSIAPVNSGGASSSSSPKITPASSVVSSFSSSAVSLPVASPSLSISRLFRLDQATESSAVLPVRVPVASVKGATSTQEIVLTLPADLDPSDPIVSDYLTLESLGILPDGFLTLLGADRGITAEETAVLITRAAFRGGKILLTPEVQKPVKAAAAPKTFLTELPALTLATCLERDPTRAQRVTFTDLLPGDPLFTGVQLLLSYATKNTDDKLLWLLASTDRPTEFGINKGHTTLYPDHPVSVLETVRGLLILRCMPPLTAKAVLAGQDKTLAGSAGSRIARDLISNLGRDVSFPSRVMYRAQDHQRAFDLSLFTYAQSFLRQDPRPSTASLSVAEASEMLASALLSEYVNQVRLSPQEAENRAFDLAFLLQKTFLEQDELDWRTEGIADRTIFTRRMFLEFLITVLRSSSGMSDTSTVVPSPSVGEVWLQRVK